HPIAHHSLVHGRRSWRDLRYWSSRGNGAQSELSAGGSHSMMRLPSGSITQPNFPTCAQALQLGNVLMAAFSRKLPGYVANAETVVTIAMPPGITRLIPMVI